MKILQADQCAPPVDPAASPGFAARRRLTSLNQTARRFVARWIAASLKCSMACLSVALLPARLPQPLIKSLLMSSLNTSQSVDLGRFIIELRVAPSLPMRF